MNLTLYIWRQAGPDAKGSMQQYEAHDISPDMSFLEKKSHVAIQALKKKKTFSSHEVKECEL